MKKAEYSILNIPLKLAVPSMRSSCTISAKASLCFHRLIQERVFALRFVSSLSSTRAAINATFTFLSVIYVCLF